MLEAKIPAELAELFVPLVEAVLRVNDGAHQRPITQYPGSPVIAAELVRPDDVIIANELHPDDRQALERALSPYRNARVMGLDGYVALK
ncbi:MAG: 23S rRNA (adenine(2030)-N(6))-methyltransferase RlmJ, partial [Filomicrobium sp.]